MNNTKILKLKQLNVSAIIHFIVYTCGVPPVTCQKSVKLNYTELLIGENIDNL